MRVREFIEQSNKAADLFALTELFYKTITEYGYSRFICQGANGYAFNAVPLKHTTPARVKEFFTEFAKNNWIEIDPVFHTLKHAHRPFTWDDVNARPLNKRQQQLMLLRSELLPHDHIQIFPLRQFDPEVTGMALATDGNEAARGANTLGELFAIVNQFHLCRSDLIGAKPLLQLPDIHLSPREKEVLRWCSQGKSNGVIGDILNISDKTVEHHLHSTFRKLDVSTRTMAVLRAVHEQLI